ncbi:MULTISPECIES: YveK family protein [Priestia]|uniref:YveK family protein n=1 Tax=Priestia TaxID=2800373 RepID=UPI001C8DFBE2|nr:Wzz/FepE/Etk N-terminal domain-containing protein [Priestia aryabhattai]MBY0214421.1 capsular biosynthesis protein [Priestia aryabhattai]MDT0148412.1 Wzz/FepE/Etk N-terminal domain-containing protein [Priestia aryabhattai]MDT0153722.1 Wzz/FepE/Etk N-terminal domain-containing protein [Priestia aryabhattai]
MEETISLRDFFGVLKKRYKLIITLAVLPALISAIISYFVLTPTYEVSTQILVNQKKDSNIVEPNQIQTNVDMINTYSEIVKSPTILEKAIKELNLPYSVNELSHKISVKSQENSQVFYLVVTDSNPTKAAKIANGVSGIFKNEVKSVMNLDNITIFAKANDQVPPTGPNKLFNVFIALIIGLIVGIGLTIILEYIQGTDKHVKV